MHTHYMTAKAHIHGQEDIPFTNPGPNRASALEQSGLHEGSFVLCVLDLQNAPREVCVL